MNTSFAHASLKVDRALKSNVLRSMRMSVFGSLLLAGVLSSASAAAISSECPSTDPSTIGELQPGVLKGYLGLSASIDSAALLSPPPSLNSPAERLDRELSVSATTHAGKPGWDQAVLDADLTPAAILRVFSNQLGFTPNETTTPHLATVLRRVMTDAGMATIAAKKAYSRDRPFEIQQTPSCTPGEDEASGKNGSYPSGHAAMGWAWALVLAELAPDRAVDILKRGAVFGDNRVVCRMHWSSDVEAGRTVSAGVVAVLHASPDFSAQMIEARAEVAQQRGQVASAQDASSAGNCPRKN